MKFESAFKNTTWIRILDFATFSFQHAMSYKKRRESIQKPPQQPLKLFNLSESSNICNVYVCICLYLKAIETSLRMTRTTLKGLKTPNLKCVMPEQV